MRKEIDLNPFRRALIKLLEIEGDNLVLSSGYATNGTAGDIDFIQALNKGIDPNKVVNPSINIIGGMFYNKKIKKRDFCNKCTICNSKCKVYNFRTFLEKVYAGINNPYSNMTFYRADTDRWHSKIALKANGGTPIAAIIGSSNLSFSAFSENYNEFNTECDILIWDETIIPWFVGVDYDPVLGKGVIPPVINVAPQNLTEKQLLDDIFRELQSYLKNNAWIRSMPDNNGDFNFNEKYLTEPYQKIFKSLKYNMDKSPKDADIATVDTWLSKYDERIILKHCDDVTRFSYLCSSCKHSTTIKCASNSLYNNNLSCPMLPF